MSASPDNRLSDILFMKYDLIHRNPENKHSALAELTGRVQPIISENRMLHRIVKMAAFLLNYEDCHASPQQMEPRKKFRRQPCCLC